MKIKTLGMLLKRKLILFAKPYLSRRILRKAQGNLAMIPTQSFDLSALRRASELNLQGILSDDRIAAEWKRFDEQNIGVKQPDGTGGVNLGDRRAIFHLVRGLEVKSVLEIGTHIGASTVQIARALSLNGADASMCSVDISDVNSETIKPWLSYNASHSPRQVVDLAGVGDRVEFYTSPSWDFLASTDRKFDLIFLDGDHSAKAVYQEIAMALPRLKPNGVILLHDYFPNMKALWKNGNVVFGPYLGVNRVLHEGADAKVIPLGALPWPTKLDSNLTSLALFLKN